MLALTREVSPAIVRCELTHLARAPLDLVRARAQHRDYERALVAAGCRVQRLPAGDGMPDSVFIEDTAVVLPEVAVLARPGAVSRRIEVPAVAEALAPHRLLAWMEEPATLDGGDVLVLGRTVFVGRSTRTNAVGVAQLEAILAPFGYALTAVETRGCLHLKSAVTALDDRTVLFNREWVSPEVFGGFDCVGIDPREPGAANVVSVGGWVICATAYPRTSDRLARRGLAVISIDAGELAKAEGALTCGSLLVA
jgi:dimethylargininase